MTPIFSVRFILSDAETSASASVAARETPAQMKLKENIATLNAQMVAMVHARSTGLDLQDMDRGAGWAGWALAHPLFCRVCLLFNNTF